MANAKQLALLEAGVEGSNKWRKKKPGVKIDLRKADLIDAFPHVTIHFPSRRGIGTSLAVDRQRRYC